MPRIKRGFKISSSLTWCFTLHRPSIIQTQENSRIPFTSDQDLPSSLNFLSTPYHPSTLRQYLFFKIHFCSFWLCLCLCEGYVHVSIGTPGGQRCWVLWSLRYNWCESLSMGAGARTTVFYKTHLHYMV